MIPWLDKIWANDKWLNHGWWEQASLLDYMGYHVQQPTHLELPTELFHRTYFLDNGWNVHRWDKKQPEHPRIQHATMWPDRVAIMKEWAEQARQGWMNESQREIVCIQ